MIYYEKVTANVKRKELQQKENKWNRAPPQEAEGTTKVIAKGTAQGTTGPSTTTKTEERNMIMGTGMRNKQCSGQHGALGIVQNT